MDPIFGSPKPNAILEWRTSAQVIPHRAGRETLGVEPCNKMRQDQFESCKWGVNPVVMTKLKIPLGTCLVILSSGGSQARRKQFPNNWPKSGMSNLAVVRPAVLSGREELEPDDDLELLVPENRNGPISFREIASAYLILHPQCVCVPPTLPAERGSYDNVGGA